MKITVGHDAEVFLQDRSGNVVPAIGLIGGTKEEPRPIENGALLEDNVMAEMNIKPCTDREEFNNITKNVTDQLRRLIRPHGLSVSHSTVAEFSRAQLSHPQAAQFGCLPDYDAWDICINPTIDLSDSTKRFAAGHIHIGVPYHDDPEALCRLVTRLDNTLGVGMRLLFGKSERAQFYGRWGAHRPTAYGVEYRVPDNSWLFKPATRRWVFDVVENVASQGPKLAPSYDRQTLIDHEDSKEHLKHFYSNSCGIKLPKVA